MRYLFHHWKKIEQQIKNAGKVLILSDYDGTLTPIVDKPDLAILSEEMKRLLQSMVKHPRYRLAIISGRAAEDVKRLVSVDGAFYVGNHGLEIMGPNLKSVYPEAERISPVIMLIREELHREIGQIEGLILEDKRLTLSVHIRLVHKEDVAAIKGAMKTITRKHGDVRVTGGKKVLEIRPKIPWDKGRASLWILKSVGGKALPLYLGDDKTDDDAFRSLKEGITILVSERKRLSKAKYFVRDTLEVQRLFNGLLKID